MGDQHLSTGRDMQTTQLLMLVTQNDCFKTVHCSFVLVILNRTNHKSITSITEINCMYSTMVWQCYSSNKRVKQRQHQSYASCSVKLKETSSRTQPLTTHHICNIWDQGWWGTVKSAMATGNAYFWKQKGASMHVLMLPHASSWFSQWFFMQVICRFYVCASVCRSPHTDTTARIRK